MTSFHLRLSLFLSHCISLHLSVCQFRTTGWHQLQRQLDTKVQIRLSDSCWCWGYFDINEIGASQVLLVKYTDKRGKKRRDSDVPDSQEDQFDEHDDDDDDDDDDDNEFQPPIVINVDIKLASSTDKCAVSIVFWSPSEAKSSDLSITNDSKYAITVTQEAAIDEIKKTAKKRGPTSSTSVLTTASSMKEASILSRQKQHVLHIPPHMTIPFGWAFPGNASKKKKILVGILRDATSAFSTKEKALVDLRIGGSQSGVPLYIPKKMTGKDNKEKGEVRATVLVELHSHGREIQILGNLDLSPKAIEEDNDLFRQIPRER